MRPNDDNARRPAQRSRTGMIDLRLPLVRSGATLSWRCEPPAVRHDLPLADILQTAAAVAVPGAFLLTGGDPLRRSDLWELLTELARLRGTALGLCTAGQGLTKTLAQRLRAVGVQRIHVPFHCARQDAHDWLVGKTGALKIAHRAIRAALDAELPVSAEVVLTRPTAAHLAETIEVLARTGVHTICVRRLTACDTDGPELVPLAARLSLIGRSLEQAAAVALERRVRLSLRDLPLCVAPRLRPLFAAPDSELWVYPDGSARARIEAGPGCPTCPASGECGGAPQDYVARFGWEEFADPAITAIRMREDVPDQQRAEPSAPMTFTWHGPRRVRCDACGDTPAEKATAQHPYESTRVIRARLVQTAQYRPSILRLVGADLLAHPQAAALVYDAVRLFRHVEIAGEASAIVDWTDLDLRRLRDIQRIDVAFYGPDAAAHDAHCGIPGAFAATLRGIERVRAKTPITIGAYAVLHDARWVAAFADAWSRGALPGEPRFRLSAKGSSLDELFQSARALPPGRARSALLAVLPRCGLAEEDSDGGSEDRVAITGDRQQTMRAGRSTSWHPCGSDPIGTFEPCDDGTAACANSGCPGAAVGWHSLARSQRWSGSRN